MPRVFKGTAVVAVVVDVVVVVVVVGKVVVGVVVVVVVELVVVVVVVVVVLVVVSGMKGGAGATSPVHSNNIPACHGATTKIKFITTFIKNFQIIFIYVFRLVHDSIIFS